MPEPYDHDVTSSDAVGSLLLEIGAMLMNSGASTGRIRITIDRIAEVFGYQADLSITPAAIFLGLKGRDTRHLFNSLKRISALEVNFRVVSGISRMSWRIVEEKWTLEEVKAEIDRLASLPRYPRWVVVSAVGLAGASLCRLFGGDLQEMAVTFVATCAGLVVRQETHKLKFNWLLSAFFASLTASIISGFFILRGGGKAEPFAASVLFLVPGVPLINGFIDLIDGHIENSIVRGVNGLALLLAVALGFSIALILFGA